MSRARFVHPPLNAAHAATAIKRLWRRAQKFSRRKLFLTGGGVAGSPPSGKTSLGING